MPVNRYDLARLGCAIAALAAVLALAAPDASAGSRGCCSRDRSASCAAHAVQVCASEQAPSSAASVAATASPAAPAAVAAWLPEWVGPAPVPSVTDYSLLFTPPVTTAPGMIIAIDPETGLLTTPTPEQRRLLTAGIESTDLLATPGAPMLLERLPGGGEILTLNGNFQSYSIARIGPDGKIVTDCASDPKTALRILGTVPVPAPAPRRVAEKE